MLLHQEENPSKLVVLLTGGKITHRSQYGIIIYCNKPPIVWYYKRQATVEISVFGSDFLAPQVASELVISLRYKL